MNWLSDKKLKPNLIRVVVRCRKCERTSAELYQLLPGGLIKARCLEPGCNNPQQSFREDEIISLPTYPCPKCHREMKPKLLKKNACYYCEVCDSAIKVAYVLLDCQSCLRSA